MSILVGRWSLTRFSGEVGHDQVDVRKSGSGSRQLGGGNVSTKRVSTTTGVMDISHRKGRCSSKWLWINTVMTVLVSR